MPKGYTVVTSEWTTPMTLSLSSIYNMILIRFSPQYVWWIMEYGFAACYVSVDPWNYHSKSEYDAWIYFLYSPDPWSTWRSLNWWIHGFITIMANHCFIGIYADVRRFEDLIDNLDTEADTVTETVKLPISQAHYFIRFVLILHMPYIFTIYEE